MGKGYSKGQATEAVRMPDGRWAVESFRGDDASYVVDLEQGTCTCPHYVGRLAGTGARCKHIESVRAQERFCRLLAIAEGLATDHLDVLLRRYTEIGDMETAGAIRVERHRRQRLAEADAELRKLFA